MASSSFSCFFKISGLNRSCFTDRLNPIIHYQTEAVDYLPVILTMFTDIYEKVKKVKYVADSYTDLICFHDPFGPRFAYESPNPENGLVAIS